MEMSLLSLAEQRTWNLFCKLTTQVLSRYPGNQDQSGGITETDAVEFLLQRANESRLSASENLQQLYEVLHGLYEVQTTTTTESTSTTAGTTTESIPTTAGTTTESIPTTAGTTTESIPTTVGTTTESILTTAGTTTESTPTTATVPSPIPNNETESTTQFINEMVELDQILQLIISNDTTVNDVISDGEITTGPNSSTSDTSQDGNTTGANQNDQSEDRTNEISKEERELFNLINTYHEQHTKAKKRIEDELTRKLDSSKSSAEEVQLQKLLIKAMKAET